MGDDILPRYQREASFSFAQQSNHRDLENKIDSDISTHSLRCT